MVSPTAARSAALLSLAAQGVLGAFHQHLTATPAGWSKAAVQPRSETNITFTLALTMQNLNLLEPMLFCVSDPSSEDYGEFKDAGELQSTFGPSPRAVNSVTAWLEASGISDYQVDGSFVDFATDLATANQIFNASYQYYTTGNVTKLRTLSYSIPDSIQEHVVLLDPSTYFGNTEALHPKAYTPTAGKRSGPVQSDKLRADASCEDGITPDCIRDMYSIGEYSPEVAAGSRVGFGSFLGQSSLRTDIAQFEDEFAVAHRDITRVVIAGGPDDQDPATPFREANLDAENIIGIAAPLPVTEFLTGGSPVQTVPYDYAVLTCTLIALQGLRGITLLSSSGDTGVGAGCIAPSNQTAEFNPIFPATCPYITSVGGTINGSLPGEPEAAWEGSSGGFSRYFRRPLYQQGAIREYLSQVDDATLAYYGNYTDFGGRGFPDVAAHAAKPGYIGVYDGRRDYNGGTSAAVPVWAAVVALLNDARFRAGKSALGWLNPLLYSARGHGALNDVTAGHSVGCNGVNAQYKKPEPAGAAVVPGAFWNATSGWDPVTGFGTPNFEKLKTLVLSF
ncbi:hypothetical protein SLS62_010909 [Diatrype stigma]|uniref:Peptidase S53 domain-containing protein n=1 Tax=Diatrype stigma TaxID=117547 RepID=A0AAN9UFJ0_9PEZI